MELTWRSVRLFKFLNLFQKILKQNLIYFQFVLNSVTKIWYFLQICKLFLQICKNLLNFVILYRFFEFFMKILQILLILLLFSLQSCAVKIYEHHKDCLKDKQEIISKFSSLVIAEQMQIKMQDANIGVAQAETPVTKNIYNGQLEQKFWNLRIDGNNLIITAYLTITQQNAFGVTLSQTTVYFDDKTHNDWGFFWNVRDGLEELCGGKFIVVEKKDGERQSTRKKTN